MRLANGEVFEGKFADKLEARHVSFASGDVYEGRVEGRY